MNKNEALLFFPFNEEDDLLDIYEERLFEYKQFFISKFPISKVFLAKEKKMLQMHESFLVLGGKINSNKNNYYFDTYTFSDSILETFNTYQNHRNDLKNFISQSTSALEISLLIHKLLELQSIYSDKWMNIEALPEKEIAISTESDPMTLLNYILEFNKLGGILFSDLNTKRNILPEILLNEAKRLSLCRKLENNG